MKERGGLRTKGLEYKEETNHPGNDQTKNNINPLGDLHSFFEVLHTSFPGSGEHLLPGKKARNHLTGYLPQYLNNKKGGEATEEFMKRLGETQRGKGRTLKDIKEGFAE